MSVWKTHRCPPPCDVLHTNFIIVATHSYTWHLLIQLAASHDPRQRRLHFIITTPSCEMRSKNVHQCHFVYRFHTNSITLLWKYIHFPAAAFRWLCSDGWIICSFSAIRVGGRLLSMLSSSNGNRQQNITLPWLEWCARRMVYCVFSKNKITLEASLRCTEWAPHSIANCIYGQSNFGAESKH